MSAADPPRAVNLDAAGWEYAPDPTDTGLRDGWTRGHGAATWSAVDLPHVFDPRPDPKVFRGQVGWYRIKLTQPTGTPAGFSWGVRFEQVRRVADVFLDGERIARAHATPTRRSPSRCRRWPTGSRTSSSSGPTTTRPRSRARAGGTGAG